MRIGTLMKLSDGPLSVAVSPSGDRVYLTNPGPVASFRNRLRGAMTIVDPHARTELARIRVGRDPSAIAADPRGTRIYVANRRSNDVSVIDAEAQREVSRIKVGTHPNALACGDLLYVSNWRTGTISVVDPGAERVLDTVATGRGPMAVVLSPSGDRVYVCNKVDGTVSAIDTRSLATVATVEVGRGALDMALDPSGTRLYTAHALSQSIAVVDTTTFERVNVIQLSTLSRRRGVGLFGDPVSAQPWAIGVSRDGNWLLVAFWEAGTLAVFHTRTGERWSETQLDDAKYSLGPIKITTDWPHRRLYVTCADNALVTVHDDGADAVG